jgi:transcription elongation factor GreA
VTQTSESVTWLTQEAHDRLKAELEHLSGPGRTEIAKKIEAAREEGDLRENGGYHAAKEEQGKQELRIRQLTQLLQRARVGEAPADTGVVAPGMVVTVRFVGDDDTMTFLLGSREDDSVQLEVYSAASPLGRAINGKRVGEQATYELPNGRAVSVEIVEAKPYVG